MLFVIVVDAPVVHQHPRPATRSSRMLEMTHHLPATEQDPIVEGRDRDDTDDDTLMSFMKKKKQKKK
jgi:hypothetical protein